MSEISAIWSAFRGHDAQECDEPCLSCSSHFVCTACDQNYEQTQGNSCIQCEVGQIYDADIDGCRDPAEIGIELDLDYP